MALFVGLMSGTSLDGADAVLVDLPERAAGTTAHPQVLSHAHRAYPEALRDDLLALNDAGGPNELQRAALAANGVARLYAELVQALPAPAGRVRAIGAHGQTVRHRPGEFDGTGFTVQLLNGALLAELTGIDVVCDLRSRDVAAGGQGAPLVPAFHAAVFARPGTDAAVLNLGGIANLTLLAADGGVRGFDCGPGNVLLDHWVRQHLGAAFDEDGRWAAGAAPDAALLAEWLAEPYFARPPPKSTGRDLFHPGWLQAALANHRGLAPQQVQATLLELTARCATDALRRHAPATRTLHVCGGGAFNASLMARLAALLPGMAVQGTQAAGVAPEQVEAIAFAWLAQAFVTGVAGNLPAVTGAAGPRLLGALYPA